MRGPVTSRALVAAIVGVVVLLAAGGGYALASSSSKKITACVHKHGGGLYSGKCAKHDKKLTWNTTGPAGPTGATGATGAPGATGPQGPGATSLVFNGAGTASPTATTLGTAGPYGLSAECIQPSAGTTTTRLLEVGPAVTIDGFDMVGTAHACAQSRVPGAHHRWRSWSASRAPPQRRLTRISTCCYCRRRVERPLTCRSRSQRSVAPPTPATRRWW